MSIAVYLFGRDGRMGRAIESIIEGRNDMHVCGGASLNGSDDPEKVDVVIDFSGAGAAYKALEYSLSKGAAHVAGTTGLGPEYDAALADASKKIPVLYSANMSLGVNVLRYLVERAAALLPRDWDIEIVELHHNKKKDSPSGTAIALLESANAGRGREPREGFLGARDGIVGERPEGEIGVFGVRGGNIAGEHTVYYIGENERIELTHRATDRDIFARGAVQAGSWLAGKAPGIYSIKDVLGLND